MCHPCKTITIKYAIAISNNFKTPWKTIGTKCCLPYDYCCRQKEDENFRKKHYALRVSFNPTFCYPCDMTICKMIL